VLKAVEQSVEACHDVKSPAGLGTALLRRCSVVPALRLSSCRFDTGGRPGARHRLRRCAALAGLVLGGLGTLAPSALATPTTTVDLGTAGTYAVLSGASVGNTVSAAGAPHTTLRGDLGVKANTAPTGFPPGEVIGASNIGNAAAGAAHADLLAAYDDIAARTGGTQLAGDLAGATLTPGLHFTAAAVSNTGAVTLDGGGDADAIFVFRIGGALTMAAGAKVTLTNGTRASRVFWQVNGAAAVGAGSRFAGTLMAADAVGIGAGTQVNGRAMSRTGAVSLDANEFYSAPPAVALDGGPTASTTDTTPEISGTTDVGASGVVTVTIAGRTLTATPAGGVWSVSSPVLPNGTYPVVASVTDAAGNEGSATQDLTVDTVLPVVTLAGPSPELTNDPTPTISGTTDVAPGTAVRVALDTLTLSALVQSDGEWNVTPSTRADGPRTVTATVTDPAGNPGSDSKELIVDTTAPAVSIAGGATALTNDPTPEITGTADVAPGTLVRVELADETLEAPVQESGAWSATASALADRSHRIVMSVTDGAGNRAGATQTLTVDTVAPGVAIAGGETATTSDLTPTISGTSVAAPGTIVTVSIAGQTMTTLLQASGTWNATPATLGEGTWPVLATASDPAGNVGSARQKLTIATSAPTVPAPTPTPEPTPDPTPTPDPAPAPAPTPDPAPTSAAATPVVAAPETTGGGAPALPAAAQVVVAGAPVQRVRGSVLFIATNVTAPRSGRVVVTATGVVRIKGVKAAIRLTGAKATLAAGGSATLRFKPKGSARTARAALARIRAALGKRKAVTAVLTLRVVDATGAKRTVTRTIKLRR